MFRVFYRKDYTLEILENKLAILNDYESSPNLKRAALGSSTQSTLKNQVVESNAKMMYQKYKAPENKTSTNNSYANSEKSTTSDSTYATSYSSIAESNTLKKYKFLGIDPDAVNATPTPYATSVMSRSYHEPLLSKTNDDVENVMSTSLINFSSTNGYYRNADQNGSKEFGNFSSNDYAKSKSTTLLNADKKQSQDDGIEKLNGLVLELNEIVKENEKAKERAATNAKTNHKFILPLEEKPFKQESKFILPLEEIDIALRRQRFSMKKCELKRLQSEQSRLMDAINNVKTKLLDIQQQKDEIIREVRLDFYISLI